MNTVSTEDFSELYSAHAAGALDPAFCLMLETQATLRRDVAEIVTVSESIAGAMLESENIATLSAGAESRALQAIDALEEDVPVTIQAIRKASERLDELVRLPDPLRDFALESCVRGGWKKLTPGVTRLKLDADSSAEVELYRIEAGRRVPRHTHNGDEFTLVVSGGFSDGMGSYGPGTICYKTPHDTHQPVADDDGTCFALAISNGGLKFTGVLGLIQRALGQ